MFPHKTKIVCTIGPASRSEEILREMMRNGMNVVRINFSHGTFEEHQQDVALIRSAASKMRRTVSILADLPGPKIRIGHLETEPMELEKGAAVTLTTENVRGTPSLIPVDYTKLPDSVARGSVIYLNDGFIELRVLDIRNGRVHCEVTSGGELRSRKGLNLPGAKLFVDAVTARDLEIMGHALREGIDTFSISFVETKDDILRARQFAREREKSIYVFAKIERRGAVDNIDDILTAADGIMIARGDLGVEVPIEDVPAIQKMIIHKANIHCRPVITATQMLESMVNSTRPTRAEVTDVANAIMDGTDAVMLSEETAIGRYPVGTVAMMSRIATSFERYRKELAWSSTLQEKLKNDLRNREITVADAISLNVIEASQALHVPFILTPTAGGMTSRRISRLKPDSWILAFTGNEDVCRFINFSYGVYPVVADTAEENWYETAIDGLRRSGRVKEGDRIILTEGKFTGKAGGTDAMGIITL